MKDITLEIITNEQVSKDVYFMRLTGDCSEIKNPGEFIEVMIPNHYLRRPFSVCNYSEEHVDILYKVLGQGTKEMTEYQVGTKLDCLLGLGNGFDIQKSKKPLFIAGGIGVAPFLSLAEQFHKKGIKPILIYGAASASDLAYVEAFEPYCEVILCTDDGSKGYKGNAISYLKDNSLDFDYYYSCGPIRMLEALKNYNENGCLSLEARMGCGFGACMGCSIQTTNGAKRVCKEGPVFEASEVLF